MEFYRRNSQPPRGPALKEPNMADSPYIIDVTRDNYADLMETSFRVPVLIDYWASWCQPCLMLMPILAKLAEEYQGRFLLGKLNTEEEQELAAQFGIRSIPTVKLFRDGGPVDEFMGALPESAVREFIDRHVGRASDTQLSEALERLRAGDADAAVAMLSAAREADPDNPRIALALAEAQAVAGDVSAAEATLDSLPISDRESPAALALRNRLYFASLVADAPAVPELEARLAANPDDSDARFRLAVRKVVDQEFEAAMDLLLELMKKDREYGDDGARKALVQVFDLLGDDPRVHDYRRRMASLLY